MGNRDAKGAKPLIDLDELGPGLRADEILGAEVRSSDDKIIGEVRNVVIGTKDRWDYAIVASGGFFTPGKDSIVVPLRYLQINQERGSFFLRIPESEMRTVPSCPTRTMNGYRTKNGEPGTMRFFKASLQIRNGSEPSEDPSTCADAVASGWLRPVRLVDAAMPAGEDQPSQTALK